MMYRLSTSIALCTYNGARYVNQQLESIARQTRLPDELVVCDDGSTDGTIDIIKEFSDRAPFPIRLVINLENLGTTRNFQSAISLCQGDVIILSDQDDVWCPSKVGRIETAFCNNPDMQALFTDAVVVDQNLVPSGYNLWEAVSFCPTEQSLVATGKALTVLLRHQVVTGATLAFRECVRSEVLPIPDHWVHDAWIALVVAARSCLGLLPEALIAYRQHSQNQIGAPRWTLLARLRQTLSMDRKNYYAGEIRRFEALRRRLTDLPPPVNNASMKEVLGKLEHLRRRSQYPKNNLLRLPFILREILTAGYRRYSTSWQVAVRDFLLR